jgi:two-component system response regulator NreC
VLLVDDHAMVREGLRMLLEAEADREVLGEASSGHEALDMVRKLRPDVVLMDVTMPGMNGAEATSAIVAMDLGTKVLGLTVHENHEYFFRMLAAGAAGYVVKGATSAELIGAIRSVHQGGVYLSPAMAGLVVTEYLRSGDRQLANNEHGLTPRELDVFRAIGKGLTNQEVADELHMSVYTVQSHRASIMRKLGLSNRHQLMRYAMKMGYVEESP